MPNVLKSLGRTVFGARQGMAEPVTLKTRSNLHVTGLLEREWVVVSLLLIWGLLVYHSHLGAPLRGEEAKYAVIARRVFQTHEWFQLEYNGRVYLNKPPLHFWLMAIPMRLWGPSEFAVHLSSATFGLGAMFLVYYCGKVLFHRRLGFIAALITSTTFAHIWQAHKAKFDIQLGFWINLGVFLLYLAYRGGGRRLGPFCLAFLAMALGTMLKGPVAVLLPGVAVFAFLVMTRGRKVFREIPFFVIGVAILLLLVGPYYWKLGGEFNRTFLVAEPQIRILHLGKEPVFFYVYTIFLEFFPWSLFLPCVGVYLWTSRSRHLSEEDLWLRVWAIGFFLLINLPIHKSERVLVLLVPPFALLMARYWDRLLVNSETVQSAEDRLLRFTSTLLALGIVLALFVGPWLIRTRLQTTSPFWPLPFALLVCLSCVVVVYTARMSPGRLTPEERRPKRIFLSILALAMAMTFGLVQFFYPALARYNSAVPISQQVRAIVGDSPLVLQIPQNTFRAQLLYYLDRPDPVPQLDTADEVYAAFRPDRQVFGLLTKDRYEELQRRGDLPFVRLADYSHRGRDYVLATNRDRL